MREPGRARTPRRGQPVRTLGPRASCLLPHRDHPTDSSAAVAYGEVYVRPPEAYAISTPFTKKLPGDRARTSRTKVGQSAEPPGSITIRPGSAVPSRCRSVIEIGLPGSASPAATTQNVEAKASLPDSL